MKISLKRIEFSDFLFESITSEDPTQFVNKCINLIIIKYKLSAKTVVNDIVREKFRNFYVTARKKYYEYCRKKDRFMKHEPMV
jgi:hypothetical protein